MAEVLGVVASGIAISQAAQTVGGAVFSLSRLWKEVKDVPDTIQHILEELELAGRIVATIEAELMASVSGTSTWPSGDGLSSIQYLAIQRCRQVHKDLSDLVDDLAADIASSRRRKRAKAKVRVVLKKEALESYEKRLQKALRFVDSAVQIQIATSIRRQPALVAAEVNELISKNLVHPVQQDQDTPSGDRNINENDTTLVLLPRITRRKFASWGKRERYSYSFLSVAYYETDKQLIGLSKAKSYRVKISPPQWLLSKAWDLQVSLAYSGWTAHFTHYAVLPDDSKLFLTIIDGTSEDVLDLFRKGRASPFSVDTNGQTPLHHAVIHHRRDLVEPLLQLGVDPLAENSLGFNAGAYYSIRSTPFDTAEKSGGDVSIPRLMLSHGVYDALQAPVDSGNAIFDLLIKWQMRNSVELFQFFQTQLFPDFYQRPLGERIQHLGLLIKVRRDVSLRGFDRRAFVRFFDPQGVFRPEHLRHRSRPGGPTVLQMTVTVYFRTQRGYMHQSFQGKRGEETRYLERTWEEMRLLIRDMAAVIDVSDLVAPEPGAGRTLLVQAVLAWRKSMRKWRDVWNRKRRWPWKHYLREYIRAWLEDLRKAGHDLEAYGKAEVGVSRDQGLSDSSLDWPPQPRATGSSEGPYRWKGFKYGPRPGDWDLIWESDPAVEEFASDFWDLVENPPLAVPGAWIDDDGDDTDDEGNDFRVHAEYSFESFT